MRNRLVATLAGVAIAAAVGFATVYGISEWKLRDFERPPLSDTHRSHGWEPA